MYGIGSLPRAKRHFGLVKNAEMLYICLCVFYDQSKRRKCGEKLPTLMCSTFKSSNKMFITKGSYTNVININVLCLSFIDQKILPIASTRTHAIYFFETNEQKNSIISIKKKKQEKKCSQTL